MYKYINFFSWFAALILLFDFIIQYNCYYFFTHLPKTNSYLSKITGINRGYLINYVLVEWNH